MIDGSIFIWGAHYRPDEFRSSLADDGVSVCVVGTLRDRVGPVVTFADSLKIVAGFRVEMGQLAADFDPAWSPNRS